MQTGRWPSAEEENPVFQAENAVFENVENSYHVVTGSGTDATAAIDGFTITAANASGDPPDERGAGMFNENSSNAIVIDCTFSANWAETWGGGMSNGKSSPIVTNCILWDNSDFSGTGVSAQIFTYGGTPVVNYSIVQGEWTGDGGTGNIASDPLFVDADGLDDVVGTEDDNLRVGPGSPAIDAGDPGFVAQNGETDLDGHARVLCGRVDMGAYEFGIGDYDCDQNVNLNDFAVWASCISGPSTADTAMARNPSCEAFDFDGDGDVDLLDFSGFQKIIRP